MNIKILNIGLAITFLFLSSIAFSQVDLLKQEPKESSVAIELSIEKVDESNYNLITSIELGKDSYIYSPFSNNEFYLPLTYNLKDNEHFVLQDELIEQPASKPEIDPYLNRPIHFVRANTTYTQKIKIINTDDFSYQGLIEYLLEPSCIPYDLEYEIIMLDGELVAQQIGVRVSEEYKK